MPTVHAHKYVADVAKAAAHELYDRIMLDNRVNYAWKATHPGLGAKALEAEFVRQTWPKALPVARATLAAMLRTPIDEDLKTTIHEALVLDATLMRGRIAAAQGETLQ